jgi:hypothetical protein
MLIDLGENAELWGGVRTSDKNMATGWKFSLAFDLVAVTREPLDLGMSNQPAGRQTTDVQSLQEMCEMFFITELQFYMQQT